MWRMGNWRLRTKLLMVLLIPSLAALGLGVLRLNVDYEKVGSLGRNSEQIRLDAASAEVVHHLQRERDLTSVYLASGGSGDRSELDKERSAVDRAIGEFEAEIAEVKGGFHPNVADRFDAAAAHLDRLRSLRAVADRNTYPPDASFRAYSDSVDSLLDLGEQGITRITDAKLLRLYLATNAMARAEQEESTKRALLGEALQEGRFRSDGERALLAADAELNAALIDFRKWASPAQKQAYDDTVAGQEVDAARTIEAAALVRGDSDQPLDGLNVVDWLNSSTRTVELTAEVDQQLRSELKSETDRLGSAARAEMFIFATLVLVSLLLAFAIALLMARSLLRPLRTLRRSALEVADKRLPDAVEAILRDPNPDVAGRPRVEPIPVHTTEEIGRVARSFDAVHAEALRLASEQALLRNNVNDLFVNLARRSQTLVQRQLSLIDRLEQDEQDPDQLGSLFELDHLATRMRRNNENLLILGGTDLTRRMMRPVPLSETVGAAVSEVEQYARIVVADSPELAIQGRVVNDFVHLVAELLENATVFSNPDTEVTVRTAYRRQELVLEIRDRGVGIDEAEIYEINERLTRPPEVDVAVSRRMGLYVVGQLARRHNIRVELQNNADLEGGVTATVHLAGDYVAQITPDGQHIPMPDVQRAQAEEQRDLLSETGTHLGLAAAFGRGGVADRPDALPERVPSSNPRPEAPEVPTGFLPDPSMLPPADENTFGNFSVQEAPSGATFGATDVPQWEEPSEQWPSPSEQWPSDEIPAFESSGFDGQCGVPPEMEGTADLFRSPFEAEKTAKFAQAPAEDQWPGPDTGDYAPLTGLGASRPPEVDDAPTERLPIYEAVLSQWFREADDASEPEAATNGSSVSATAEADDSLATDGQAAEADPLISASEFSATPNDSVQATNGATEYATADSTGVGSTDTGEHDSLAESNGFAGSPEPEAGHSEQLLPTPKAPDPGWGSADVGWQAAEALVQQTRQVQETTSAGLPKRVPKSNLVPGSAAPRPSSTPSKPATPRSPDAVRGRMSNFQQGIRRGRHAKAEPVSTEQPNSNSSRHEEQE